MPSKNQKAIKASAIRTASLLGIFVNYGIFHVLNDVKNGECPCTDDWRMKFCRYYSIFMMGLNAIFFILGSRDKFDKIMPMVQFLNFVNIVAMISYLHKLSDSECNCEKSSLQRMMRYIGYIIAGMYVVMFVFFIIMMITLMFTK